MKPLSKNAIIGYPTGIITGITNGLNPLFVLPLMKNGAIEETISEEVLQDLVKWVLSVK